MMDPKLTVLTPAVSRHTTYYYVRTNKILPLCNLIMFSCNPPSISFPALLILLNGASQFHNLVCYLPKSPTSSPILTVTCLFR